VRKKIVDTIYFVLFLTTIFSSSYVMLYNISSKGNISCTDTDIELLEDSSMTDSNETSVEQLNGTMNGITSMFDMKSFFSLFNVYFYLQNTYEIYLGLNTPPPKYF
jgi:hypothetical protein